MALRSQLEASSARNFKQSADTRIAHLFGAGLPTPARRGSPDPAETDDRRSPLLVVILDDLAVAHAINIRRPIADGYLHAGTSRLLRNITSVPMPSVSTRSRDPRNGRVRLQPNRLRIRTCNTQSRLGGSLAASPSRFVCKPQIGHRNSQNRPEFLPYVCTPRCGGTTIRDAFSVIMHAMFESCTSFTATRQC